MRYYCLACGGYWKIKSADPRNCPYCADVYYGDNVTEDVPPVIKDILVECHECKEIYYVEHNDDHTCCPVCGCKVKNKKEGDSLAKLQTGWARAAKL